MLIIVRKSTVTELEKEIERLRCRLEIAEAMAIKKGEFISDLASRFPEVRRYLLNLHPLESEENNRESFDVSEYVPERLPTRMVPGLQIIYSARFIRHFEALSERIRGRVLNSINFLAEHGKNHQSFKSSSPLRRRTRGIDPYNCFMICLRQGVAIIYQDVETGVKFRDVLHDGQM